MSEQAEYQNHLPQNDDYTEAKARLTKLVEQFDFELTDFRNTWVDKSDVGDATKELVCRMGRYLKQVGDELARADEKRKAKQRECKLVTEVNPDNEALLHATCSKEASHAQKISPPNRKETQNSGSSPRPGLRSILIEVIGDWDKRLHVRYHNTPHVKVYSPAPQPPANRRNESDQTLRGRLLKARVAACNHHLNEETMKCQGPATSPAGYQWTRRYGTPPPRFAELNGDQDKSELGYFSSANSDRKGGLEGEEGEEWEGDSDESYDSYEGDDESGDESQSEISNVGDVDEDSRLILKRSREDDGEEKEGSLQPGLKKPRMA